MTRGRRIALAVWIIANAVVLALLVLEPVPLLARTANCSYADLRRDDCPGPYVERRELLAGAILGNGIALAAWVTTRTRPE